MPRNITEVAWGYSGRLPNGISFKEETGTFSGTPTKVGEYTIPVTVWTNYGTDTKDVKIVVRAKDAYNVYAIGSLAATWSGDTIPDEDGFYGLDIPPTRKLVTNQNGFGAITFDNKFYCCGYYGLNPNATNTSTSSVIFLNANKPYLVGENIEKIIYGITASSKTNYQCYFIMFFSSTSLEGAFVLDCKTSKRWTTSYYDYSGTTLPTVSNVIYPDDFNFIQLWDFPTVNNSLRILHSSGDSIYHYSVANTGFPSAKVESVGYKAAKVFNSTNYNVSTPLFTYLSEAGYLDNNPNNFTQGIIQNAWVLNRVACVLTDDNHLYEYNTKSKAFELKGVYDIKRLQIEPNGKSISFLTNDGKLYHKGDAATGVTDAHTEFTQIFPNCKFHDFTFDGSTLTVIKE